MPTLGTIPAELVPIQQRGLDDYILLTKDEQLTYWAALYGSEANIRSFAEDAYLYTEDERDLLPDTISEGNSPEEIVQVLTYGERLAFALSGDDRYKAAMTVLEDSRGSARWGGFERALTEAPDGLTGGMVVYNDIVPMPSVVSAGDVARYEGTDMQYRDIVLRYANGVEEEVRAVLHPVTYNDEKFYWWTKDTDF
ncbi:hypothetical protein R8Z57_07390 [Microbacterium sp. M3]|uniref:Uncharacterized protein n=1 Tax=Microbacterium arthrosphaerae TaxID=792652 RepID=A0ABU4H1I9_9MICO|nr:MULTISPECIES: hypothetical protein [Microbacterium]MDW4572602.1 hypothetical protein [Microbacterium arthrosphaerae]MDW7606457.1 hypothetical protein [Microbacterium sp. M3]